MITIICIGDLSMFLILYVHPLVLQSVLDLEEFLKCFTSFYVPGM